MVAPIGYIQNNPAFDHRNCHAAYFRDQWLQAIEIIRKVAYQQTRAPTICLALRLGLTAEFLKLNPKNRGASRNVYTLHAEVAPRPEQQVSVNQKPYASAVY
jgi:hypothetical protein